MHFNPHARFLKVCYYQLGEFHHIHLYCQTFHNSQFVQHVLYHFETLHVMGHPNLPLPMGYIWESFWRNFIPWQGQNWLWQHWLKIVDSYLLWNLDKIIQFAPTIGWNHTKGGQNFCHNVLFSKDVHIWTSTMVILEHIFANVLHNGWKHTMPPKFCNHKHKNYAFEFFWYIWTSHLEVFLFISSILH